VLTLFEISVPAMTHTLRACRPDGGGDPVRRATKASAPRPGIVDGDGAGAAFAETALFELSIGRGRLDADDPNGGNLGRARNPSGHLDNRHQPLSVELALTLKRRCHQLQKSN
jgi:hypothetical protein